MVESNRVEFKSAGSLPFGITKEEFFSGMSNPRNREIMRVFKDLEMVEQLGSGVPRILRAYSKESFIFMQNFTRMVFAKGGQIGGQIGGSIYLTDRQKDIIDLLKQNSKISRKAISQKLDIAESAVQKHLETLKNKGAIKRVGGTRGWWEVLV